MFCIATTKLLLLWITYNLHIKHFLELNDFFGNRKHTAEKREKNKQLMFNLNKGMTFGERPKNLPNRVSLYP